MAADKPSDYCRSKLWAIGPIPPPVTGMTLVTERVLRRLEQAGPLVFCNWSHGRKQITPYAHGIRLLRTIRCLIKFAFSRRAPDRPLYLVANSRSGLLLTVLFVFVGRRRGHRIYLHHHTYGYIDRYNRWMAWIDRRMGGSSVHVVHCDRMIEDFRCQYASKCQFETIYPSVVSIDIGRPRSSASRPFRLGMLSNLTIDKGLDLAINTFQALHDKGCHVSLELAGPIGSRTVENLVDQTLKSHPQRVRYLGPVYGEAKKQFLHNIDALLFPTRYKEESWGIVLNEALAAGAPVITFDRGCTQTVVGGKAGLVIDRNADFVRIAGDQIQRWINDDSQYRSASQAAVEQAAHLFNEGNRMLDEFADRIFADQQTPEQAQAMAGEYK